MGAQQKRREREAHYFVSVVVYFSFARLCLFFFLIWSFFYHVSTPTVALSIFGILFPEEEILFFFQESNKQQPKKS